ncbi:hypothetical protein BI313_16455 [Xanthomonas vesicatoria]|nr:hypothetical protein BI313_16455 [Xanthomonas vesicatoria]
MWRHRGQGRSYQVPHLARLIYHVMRVFSLAWLTTSSAYRLHSARWRARGIDRARRASFALVDAGAEALMQCWDRHRGQGRSYVTAETLDVASGPWLRCRADHRGARSAR